MMHPEHLRTHVIKPTLKHLGLWSEAAENLLLLTAAAESHLGRWLVQHPIGPARGIYQIETATEFDVHTNFLAFRPELKAKIAELTFACDVPDQTVGNLFYSTAIARIIYRRAQPPLPAPTDWAGLAAYHKRHFNTHLGKATVEKTLELGRELGVIKD